MYTATMVYEFKKGCLDSGVKIWKDIVLGAAQGQPGLIRMQLLVGSSKIMAQGSWEDESCAQKFMRTGIFQVLMEKLRPLMNQDPRGEIWELAEVLEG
jgi:quinol monooxygenase YgiN